MKYTPKYGGKGEVLNPKDGKPKGKKLKGTESGKKDPLIKDNQGFYLTAHGNGGIEYEPNQQRHGMGVVNSDGTITINGFTVPVGYKKPKDNLTTYASESLKKMHTESANPRMNLFNKYCAKSSVVTPYGAMDFFAQNKVEVPSTSEFVALMESSENYSFSQLPNNDNVFVVTSLRGNRLFEHARQFLSTKKMVVESGDLSPRQKGMTLNKIYAAMFGNVSPVHMSILPESMTTHMLSMPSGVVGYSPTKMKKHKKKKKVAGMPENFKSVGNFDEVKVTNESIEVPPTLVKAVTPITRKIKEFQDKLVVNESTEKVVYRTFKKIGEKTILMSEGSSALGAAIDAFEISGIKGQSSVVEIATMDGSKKLKTTSVVIPTHNKFKPINGNLFRFTESAKILAPKGRLKKHGWGCIVENFEDNFGDEEEANAGEEFLEDDEQFDSVGSVDDSTGMDDPCDVESETVEDGIMNLIKTTLQQHCADCCVSLEDGSEYDVSFDENCVTVDYGDGRSEVYCISISKQEDDVDGAVDSDASSAFPPSM